MAKNIDYFGDWQNLPVFSPAVICIGKFDGVHLGHQQLLLQGQALANELQVKLRVVCFDPHPSSYFSGKPLSALTTIEQRSKWLRYYKVDEVVCLKFNSGLAELGAEEFLQFVLLNKMQAQGVVVGQDFCFGRGKAGNIRMLDCWAKNEGLQLIVADDVCYFGRRISASWCVECLQRNQDALLLKLLNRDKL